MKKINIKVLLVDSVPARIYMALLKKNGFYAEEVLLLEIEPKAAKYKLFKDILGRWLARKVLSFIVFLKGLKGGVIDKKLGDKLLSEFGLTNKDIQLGQIFSGLEKIQKISVAGINDSKLRKKIETDQAKTFLFTGGGMLEERILSIHGVKIIHIHPGIVPEVKGADGFYWSFLLRKKAGYSVFYMNAGIDTGDVVYQKEFDVSFSSDIFSGISTNSIYRTILEFYDPCLRALTFIELINQNINNPTDHSTEVNLSNLTYKKQDPNAGRTYFFMHEKLREFVINKLKEKY